MNSLVIMILFIYIGISNPLEDLKVLVTHAVHWDHECTPCTCKGFCGPVLIHSLNWNPIDMQLKLLLMLGWHNQHSVNSQLGVNKCLQCQLIQLMQYSVMHMSWSTLGWLSTHSWSRVDQVLITMLVDVDRVLIRTSFVCGLRE